MESFPGEKLIIKLWDTIVDKGIGSLIRPWQIKREEAAYTKARRNDIIALAEAELEAQKILKTQALTDQSKESHKPLELSFIQEKAENNKNAENIRKEINISRVVIHAENALANSTKKTPSENIDEDWLFKWKNGASEISDDDLQQLWGKVLAGELESPGKYSLRTLEFLKNMSQYEAKLIEKLAPLVIFDFISRNDKKFLEEQGITYNDLIFLQEIGIVVGVEASAMSATHTSSEKGSFQLTFTSGNRALHITHKDQDKVLSFPIYGLSHVGKQVLPLGVFTPNEEYLISFGKRIADKDFSVELGDWKKIDETHGNFSNPVAINKDNI